MLLKPDYANGDIVCFKLVNGDEILARVENTTAGGWALSKPLNIIPSEQGIGLMQSMFGMDVEVAVELQRSAVMMHTPVVKELADHYILTTTGIQPVTRGSIITGE
jgi:hypothetical protein